MTRVIKVLATSFAVAMRVNRGKTPPAWRALTGVLFLLLMAASIPSPPLSAQNKSFWAGPTTLGYAGFGCWVGYLGTSAAVSEADLQGGRAPSVLVGTVGACLAGGYVGLKVGREADSLLARGEALPTGLRRGIQLGTVLTGASLASLISLLPASQREGQKAETVLFFSLGGAVVGAIAQAILNDRLDPVGSAPSIQVGRTGDGRTFLGLALRR